MIVEDGYNLGRDWLVERAEAGSHFKGIWWRADVDWREGLLEPGHEGSYSFPWSLADGNVLNSGRFGRLLRRCESWYRCRRSCRHIDRQPPLNLKPFACSRHAAHLRLSCTFPLAHRVHPVLPSLSPHTLPHCVATFISLSRLWIARLYIYVCPVPYSLISS